MKKLVIGVICLLWGNVGFGGETDKYEAILLPLAPAVGRAGAGGSPWNIQFTIFNASETPISLLEELIGLREHCTSFACLNDLPPGVNVVIPVIHERDRPFVPPVHLLRVQTDRLKDVHIDPRVSASGTDQAMATQVPAVPERDMFSGEIVLLNVPWSSATSRSRLRVYGVGTADVPVLVELFDANNRVVHEQVLNLRVPVTSAPSPLPRYPAYVEWPIPVAPGVSGVARTIITPLSGDGAYWAFASVTSNATSHVVTIVPSTLTE